MPFMEPKRAVYLGHMVTTKNLTIQTFDYNGSDRLTNALLTAEVLGFGVAMECEPAQIGNASLTSRPWASILAEYLVADISGPSCQLKSVVLGQSPDHGDFHIVNTTSNYQGLFGYYICNSGFSYENAENPTVPQPNATSPEDFRFLLTMSEVTWNSLWSNETAADAPATTNWTIARSTGVLCKPSYSVDKYKVTLVPSNQTLQKADIIPNTSTNLTGFDLKNLLDGIVNTLTVSIFGQGGDDYSIIPVPPMFELLAGLNNNSRQEPLIDPNLLQNLSTQALQGIGTQFAERYLKQGQNQPLSGFVAATRQRLQIKRLPVGLLLTTLSVLAIDVLIIIGIRPWNSAPCATESLASAATILAARKALREHFQAQSSALDNPVTTLENRDYWTLVDSEGHFTIQPVLPASKPRNTFLRSKETRPNKTTRQWWRPIAIRRWFIACLLLIPLILIAVLEVV